MTISSPSVAVIDYGTGNLRSVIKAFETLGSVPFLVSSPDEIGNAEALVFPGQVAFRTVCKACGKVDWQTCSGIG